jgi:Spy/CpxP family protein refolding chaperone
VITGKWIVTSAVALMMGSVLFAADDTMPPASDTPAPTHHHSKLIKPYSELTGLTDDQKTTIIAAHSAYLKAEKELLAKEKADINAVLTDDQKAELKTLQEKETAARKGRNAEKHEGQDMGEDATTQPAQ